MRWHGVRSSGRKVALTDRQSGHPRGGKEATTGAVTPVRLAATGTDPRRPSTRGMNVRKTPKRIKRILHNLGLSATLAATLKDPRRKGSPWPFALLVDVLLVGAFLLRRALLTVEQDSEAMGVRVPDSTLAYLLARVDPTPLRQVLVAQIRAMHRSKSLRPVGLPFGVATFDGKTTWTGSYAGDTACQKQGAHWNLRAMRVVLTSAASRPCLDQHFIPPETNEMGYFKVAWAALLRSYGRADLFAAVTLDAGYASKENATLVDDAGKGYVLRINASQPTLLAEMQRVLRPRAGQAEAVSPWERVKGRELQRRLVRSEQLVGFDGWPHLRQAWLVQTVVLHADRREEVVEERYFATNLPWKALTPSQILLVVRGHWRIENDCNWVLDMQWEEDTSAWTRNRKAVATHHPLQVQAWLRMLAYNVLGWLKRVRLRSHPSWPALQRALDRVLLPYTTELEAQVAAAALLG